jgi:selenocysteine lyase/cysteine desulfurase
VSDEEKVRALRELLPATGAGIYLDTAYRGPFPAETHAAMAEAEEWELRVGRAAEGREDDFAQKRDEARAVVAALIGADPDDIRLGGPPPGIEFQPLVDPESGAIAATPGAALDATLAVGAVPVDVNRLGADVVYFAGDRWLLGPEGTGATWTRPSSEASTTVRDFELGRTQVLGLARSIGWLEMYVGLDWIFERGARLANRLREQLAGMAGMEAVTPADAPATIVVFRLPAWPIDAALNELRRRVFAIVGQTESGAIRASVAWFNTDEELDRFATAVAELARHTPETLPRRASLVVH